MVLGTRELVTKCLQPLCPEEEGTCLSRRRPSSHVVVQGGVFTQSLPIRSLTYPVNMPNCQSDSSWPHGQ